MSLRARIGVAVTLGAVLLASACTQPAEAPQTRESRSAPTSVLDGSAYGAGRPLRSVPDVRPDGVVSPPPGHGRTRYATQALRWRPCPVQGECATVLAPLDWNEPDGEAVRLAVTRIRYARSTATLFVGPGGPGLSGVELARHVAHDRGLGRYDVVGWDLRGSGDSAAIRCDERLAGAAVENDVDPADQTALDARVRQLRAVGRSCLQRSGALLAHVSTVESVADLELLRTLLGEQRVNFYGVSYGTVLGTLYAATYPKRVGRMVLDGVVDLQASHLFTSVGTERQLHAFARWCVEQGCPLGSDPTAVSTAVANLLDGLTAAPMAAGPRRLTRARAVEALWSALSDEGAAWTSLMFALRSAIEQRDGEPLRTIADDGRGPDGTYPWYGAQSAIRCLDFPSGGVSDELAAGAVEAARSPILGHHLGVDLTCASWPVAPVPHREVADPDVTVLLVGTTGDPRTPIESAEAVAARFPASRLLTYEGNGHVAYNRDACVREHVLAYLADGTLPARGTTCRS